VAVAAVGAAALSTAAPAVAAPLPQGQYDAAYSEVSLRVGPVTLSAPAGPAGRITVGAATETPLPAPSSNFAQGTLNSAGINATATVTMDQPFSGAIDPATGAAHFSGAGHARLFGTAPLVDAFDCSLGSAAAPIPVNLSTAAPGSPWNPANHALAASGNATIPVADCVEDADESLVNALLASYNPIVATVRATLTPPGAPPTGGGGGGGGAGGGGGGQGGGAPGARRAARILSGSIVFNKRGVGTLRLRCPSPTRCAGSAQLSSLGKTSAAAAYASARFSIAPNATKTVRLKLRKPALAALRKRGRLRARLTVRTKGFSKAATRKVTLRMKR
jgi:hypothetical protein